MANFDLDDPLADLLSDGSNDSFFEEPKALVKKGSLTKTPEKKSVSELFGIDKSDVKPINSNSDWLGLLKDTKEVSEKTQSDSSPKKLVKKISFENDNILSNLNVEAKASKQDIKSDIQKRNSLSESTFKPILTEENMSFDEILKSNKLSKKADMNIPSQDKPMKKLEDFQLKNPPIADGHRVGRRSHQAQSGFTDFLGIMSAGPSKDINNDLKKLTSPIKKIELTNTSKSTKQISNSSHVDAIQTEVLFPAPANREMKTKSAPNIGVLPNWLDSGGSSIEVRKVDLNLPLQVESEGAILNKEEDFISEVSLEQQGTQTFNKQQSDNFLHSLISQQKLATCDAEYQNTAIAMQQQNSQLVMALQLKKYEENLAVMQRKQQQLLSKQEKQFNWLLERQLTKQQIIENNMRMQQERINSHMQMLLSQSSVDETFVQEDFDKIQGLKKSTENESTRLFEELLDSLKQKSQEEKFLLEESYNNERFFRKSSCIRRR